MKVKELIELLKTMPPDCETVVPGVGSQEDSLVTVERVKAMPLVIKKPGFYAFSNDEDVTGERVVVVRLTGEWVGDGGDGGEEG